MGLQTKLTVTQKAQDNTSFVLQEATGNYNVSTNAGGFGAPNPERTDFSYGVIQLSYFGQTTPSTNDNIALSSATSPTLQDFLNNVSDIKVTSTLLGQTILGSEVPFSDGIHTARYVLTKTTLFNALEQYNGDPFVISGPTADITALFTDVAEYLTATLETSVGSLTPDQQTTVLLHIDKSKPTVVVSPGVSILYLLDDSNNGLGLPENDTTLDWLIGSAYVSDTNILLDGLVTKCLVSSIAKQSAISCNGACPSELVNQNMFLYMEKLNGEIKFNCGDYVGAQLIYSNLSSICNTTKSSCGCS